MIPPVRLLAVFAAALAAAPAAALLLLTEETPPFNYTDGGRPVGLSNEIVAETAKRAGMPTHTEVLPWSRAYVRAQAERDTCLYSTARDDSRERAFLWIGPIAKDLWAVYAKGDFQATTRSLNDLKPYRIGGDSRDAKVDFLRENAVSGVRAVAQDRINPPELLLPRDNPDRIDLWITGLHSGRETAKATKVTDLKLVFIAGEQPLYLACSPQTPRATVKALSDALESVRADGTLARITCDYEKRFAR